MSQLKIAVISVLFLALPIMAGTQDQPKGEGSPQQKKA